MIIFNVTDYGLNLLSTSASVNSIYHLKLLLLSAEKIQLMLSIIPNLVTKKFYFE